MSQPSPENSSKLGLVLSAGGARAAYQVGVLSYIVDEFPEFLPQIFVGSSAGSINASFLSQGDPIKHSVAKLAELWSELEFDQVISVNFGSLFAMSSRWLYDMFASKVTNKLLVKSLLDASPLAKTLLSHLHFWKVSRAIRSGAVKGLAISATNYYNGTTTIFYDSYLDIKPWKREQRHSLRTAIRLKHIMASCSIPLLFEPVPIGDALYGDGSLRFSFPFSPAMKLGARKVFAISTRCTNPQNVITQTRPDHLGLGYIAGAVLNSIFLDSVDFDYENLCRINAIAGNQNTRRIPALLLRPSRDLGAIAANFLSEVPFHFRQVLKATASPLELGDLLSYLMFSKGYIRALIELGRSDAAAQKENIKQFFAE
jgi:NTE family protein